MLPRIDVPTLLVWGGESNFYDLATARYVHEQIHGSVLHVYDDTDHSPHQWQRERFERDLLAICRSLMARRSHGPRIRAFFGEIRIVPEAHEVSRRRADPCRGSAFRRWG